MTQEGKAGEILLLDKPLGWTSFQLVKKVKWLVKAKKAGHAGTLDPLATGLLIICTERSTKKIENIQNAEKEYTGTLILGAITPSYDLETNPEQHKTFNHITENDLELLKPKFTGIVQQAPPLYSAMKIDGKRAYELARAGIEHEMKKRSIVISELYFTRFAPPEIDFRVVCAKGTYIRSLVHDMGQELGCGAYLSALRRTRIGEFRVIDAVTPQEMEKSISQGNADYK